MTTRQIAKGIAQLGRHGDSTLVHMQPQEVAGLQALAKANGTSLTINPDTGLPEAFSLGGFFKSLLPTIAGFAAAGMSGGAMSPMLAGILAGAGTGALTNKDPLSGALMGGLGGYGGANLFSAAKGFTPTVSGATTAKSAVDNQVLNNLASSVGTTADQALLDPLVSQQISMYTPAGGAVQTGALGGAEATYGALTAPTATTAATGSYAPNFNPIAGATQGTGGYSPPSIFASDTSALSSAAGNVAADPFGFAMQNKMNVGMPLAGAVLGGLEPSDLYGTPATPQKRVIPTLNLNDGEPLNLYKNYPTYAAGGPVSFADGGDAMKEGGLDTLGYASLPPLTPQSTAYMTPAQAMASNNLMQGQDTNGTPNLNGMPNTQTVNGIDAYMGRMGPVGSNTTQITVTAPSASTASAAPSSYAAQVNKALEGEGGMGSTQGIGALKANPNGVPTGPVIQILDNTAPTAQTAFTRMNGNRYAVGGPVTEGGIQNLYGTQDGTLAQNTPAEGYGLDRLNRMSEGGVPSYANGGALQGGGSAAMQGGNLNLNTTSGVSEARPSSSPTQAPTRGFNSMAEAMRILSPNRYNSMEEGMRLIAPSGLNSMELALDSLAGPRQSPNPYGYAKGGYLDGPGDGMSDSIPATIEGKQPARLADGEFVVPADVVSHLGNGSTKAGSQRLYGMLDRVRKARTGTKKQGRKINADKLMPA